MAEIRVRFHQSLYPPAVVASVAERFAHLASPQVVAPNAESADTVVVFQGVPERLQDRFADEFANHVLFQVIVDQRAGAGR